MNGIAPNGNAAPPRRMRNDGDERSDPPPAEAGGKNLSATGQEKALKSLEERKTVGFRPSGQAL